MSDTRFQFTKKYGHLAKCSQFLDDLIKDYPGLDMKIVTGSGSVSVSSRVMQLLSPLVRDVMTSLPVTAAQESVTVIIPDTDTAAVNKMMELLMTGQTYLDTKTKDFQDRIVSLAKSLQITVNRVEKVGKIRVRSMNELMMKPCINNNNIVGADENIIEAENGSNGNVKDRCQEDEDEQVIEINSDADGEEVLQQTNLLYDDYEESTHQLRRYSITLETLSILLIRGNSEILLNRSPRTLFPPPPPDDYEMSSQDR